jgi:hypothetical protein
MDPKIDSDDPGEPDRDAPAEGLGSSEGSDDLMDPEVLKRAQEDPDADR